MTAFPTEVLNAPSLGSAGREARASQGFRDVETMIASAEVPFGRVVTRASAGTVSAGGSTPIGVSLAQSAPSSGTSDSTPENGEVHVMSKGYILVQVAGAVTPTTQVRYNTTNGTFVTSAVSATVLAITNARYTTAADADGVAILRVNL